MKLTADAYAVQVAPLSRLYCVAATPDKPSVALSVSVTALTNQPFDPMVPARLAVVTGGVRSIRMVAEFVASTLAWLSIAQ